MEYISPVASAHERITYGQLKERVQRVAGMLKAELGVKRGDTVIIYSTDLKHIDFVGQTDD